MFSHHIYIFTVWLCLYYNIVSTIIVALDSLNPLVGMIIPLCQHGYIIFLLCEDMTNLLSSAYNIYKHPIQSALERLPLSIIHLRGTCGDE